MTTPLALGVLLHYVIAPDEDFPRPGPDRDASDGLALYHTLMWLAEGGCSSPAIPT